RKISPDVKRAAIRLFQHGHLSLPDILDCVGFSERTFWRCKRLMDTTGDVLPPQSYERGRPRTLLQSDVDYLLELVNLRPSWFLDELQHLAATNRLIDVHYTTIHRELERRDISVKQLRRTAKERN
ncbi:hypothetical protein BV25DRAFT_1776568, partial [Artomyces pyxidatus]